LLIATEIAPRAQRLLRHTTQPKPHDACRADPTHSRGRNRRALAEPDPGSHREPKSTSRSPDQCRCSPQPKSPRAAHILLDLHVQPKLHALVLCRAASRSSARTVDPMKRLTASFSVHTFVREARRANPSSDESPKPAVRRPLAQPGPLSEDTVPARHRTDQNKFRSALQRELVSSQLPPVRPRSCEIRAPKRTGWRLRTVEPPKELDSGSPSDRSREMRPALARLDCKQPSFARAGQTS
jgi:hypothetical protein